MEQSLKKSGSENRQRQARVSIRMTESERAEIEAQAAQAGLTTASYARALLLSAPPPRSRRRPPIDVQEVARLVGELGKIGSNLNQIAHRLNTGLPIAQGAIAAALSDVQAMRSAALEVLGRQP